MNWIIIFNRLFEIINTTGDGYYSGPRFLNVVRALNYSIPSYQTFIDQRSADGLSTSRRDYFYDVLMEQSESDRVRIVNAILSGVEPLQPERVGAIRQIVNGASEIQGPQAIIPQDIWNSERLSTYLESIDSSITEGNYEHTLTLAYTCLEGFYKSFIRQNISEQAALDEINPMARVIKDFISTQLQANQIRYPEQILTLISTVTNAVSHARNNFSDSHSGNRAERWVAVYVRDSVNSIVKMLLNFM